MDMVAGRRHMLVRLAQARRTRGAHSSSPHPDGGRGRRRGGETRGAGGAAARGARVQAGAQKLKLGDDRLGAAVGGKGKAPWLPPPDRRTT